MKTASLSSVRALVMAGVVALTAPGVHAQTFERSAPGAVGLSAEKLALATADLQARVDAGDIAGVVAAVVRDSQLVYAEALGMRDIAAGAKMPFDALFRTYSMTRPITALGILMLHDEGLLDVNDTLHTYLPQFADQQVLVDAGSTDVSATRPRQGDITLAQLLTHTSGLGSRSSALYRTHNVHSYDQSLAQVVDNVAQLPLFEDPGTAYRYGLHAEVLGRVIEVVSGQDIGTFFQQRIFAPLGMSDTVFYVDPARTERLATVYRPDDSGQLLAHEMESIPVTGPRALSSAGVGLVSSTMDFLRFSQLFLDNGRVNGEQLVSPAVVRMMAENAVPEALLPIGSGGYWRGSGWSLGGMAVVLEADTYNHTVNEGEYWWDGSAGTRFWIDPEENMVTIIMAQISPASGNGFRESFKTLVYDAIE